MSIKRTWWWFGQFFTILLVGASASFAEDPSVPRATVEADRLVQAALEARLTSGDESSQTLLSKAIRIAPDHGPARWHAGFVRSADGWRHFSDVPAAEPLTMYRQMRDRMAGNLAGEIALARWCGTNDLPEQAQFHWCRVFQASPNNSEARRALGLKKHRGMWLTAEQIASWKESEATYKAAEKSWRPRLAAWCREIDESDEPTKTAAWIAMSEVQDPNAIPFLEEICHREGTRAWEPSLSALDRIESGIAVDAMSRIAVFAPEATVRDDCARRLGHKSVFAYVPMLIGRLEAPIEFHYLVSSYGTSFIRQHGQIRQELPTAVVSTSLNATAQFQIVETGTRATSRGFAWARKRGIEVARLLARRQYREMLETAQRIEARNLQSAALNERVIKALRTATGADVGNTAQDWWKWWHAQNEYHYSDDKPEYEIRQDYSYEFSVPRVSCFLAGTPVRTESGPVPIEQIKPGDRVLSQDPVSGELTHQLVLNTTTRPASPLIQIWVGNERIVATLGHPFWVAGSGWKMAQGLKRGDLLHCADGTVPVEKVEPGPTFQAHNLVVNRSHTYFVMAGGRDILVHDNTLQQLVDSPLPGWADASP